MNGDSQSQEFNIVADPRSESTLADMKRQFDFISDVNKTMDDAHKSIKKIRKINAQLSAFQKQYKGDDRVKDLIDKAKELSDQFSDIEKALYQTKNRSRQDPLNFPIKLNNRFNALQRSIENGDARPTDAAYVVYEELTEELNGHMAKLNSTLEKDLPKVNAILAENGISTIEAQ